MRRRLFGGLLAALVVLTARPAAAQDIVVFAAASLKTALDAVAAGYGARTGVTVTVSYAASSALARQIESGAPADLFIAADTVWMDHLEGLGLIRPGSRRALLGNRLALVVPADAAATVAGLDPAPLLGPDGRLAMGQVDSVPAGRYAKAALQTLGYWSGVEDRLAQAENARAALALVARGEAPAGIVYATDAAAEPKVRVAAIFPPDSHPPIIYPAALTAAAGPRAAGFLDHLSGPEAASLFAAQGFTVLDTGR